MPQYPHSGRVVVSSGGLQSLPNKSCGSSVLDQQLVFPNDKAHSSSGGPLSQ